MTNRDIVVIGASAGGVYALKEFVSALPPDFPGTIFIVQHVAADSPSYLPAILNYAGKLEASHPVDGERIQRSHIYIAPPDHHLLVENDQVLVKRGPKENGFRPSIDALFRSAAYNYRSRVIGVVLTGLLNDGTSGMWSIKRLGGISVIQQPQEALYPSMPESVRKNVDVDYTVPISQLAPLLGELVEEHVEKIADIPQEQEERMSMEVKIAQDDDAFDMDILKVGKLSLLTCPECHGALVSIEEGNLIRYRCHTGHGFTAGSLLTGIKNTVEESLWNAIRSLDESIILLEQAAKAQEEGGDSEMAQAYKAQIEKARQKISQIRPLILAG
jgi:two-component system chemotaxis response regulator CheB